MDLGLLKDNLRRHEGLRLHPYRCTSGRLTIGYGRNLDDSGISEAEAEMLLTSDVAAVVDGLDRVLPWWRQLGEPQQVALAEMAFNLGIRGLAGFGRMLHALRQGDNLTAAHEALASRWAQQVGQRALDVAALMRS